MNWCTFPEVKISLRTEAYYSKWKSTDAHFEVKGELTITCANSFFQVKEKGTDALMIPQVKYKRSDARIPKPKKNKLAHSPKSRWAELEHIFRKSKKKNLVGNFLSPGKRTKSSFLLPKRKKMMDSDGQFPQGTRISQEKRTRSDARLQWDGRKIQFRWKLPKLHYIVVL